MVVDSKPLRWTTPPEGEAPQPLLEILAFGVHDVYRVAHHLESGQVDIAAMGRKIKAGLRRKLSRDQWDWLQQYMHGDGGF